MSKLFRFKCPKCGKVQDVPGDAPCWKCHTLVTLPKDGVIQLYRMASCGWWNHSMEVYLNGIRLGYVKYEGVVTIPVPYGHYQVVAKFMDYKMNHYKGQGLEFDITPYDRIMYLRAARCIPGFGTNTVILEPAVYDEMKQL